MAYEVPKITEDNCAGCGEPIPMNQCRIWNRITGQSWHAYCERLIETTRKDKPCTDDQNG